MLHHLSESKQRDDGLFAKKVDLKSTEFLKANPTLLVDTRHFSLDFTARLLEAMGDLDEQADGVLFHSENFQALRLLVPRYEQRVTCTYADPPFNTAASEIVYKNEYKHSSWLAMLSDRVRAATRLMAAESSLCLAIDDAELTRLVDCLAEEFGEDSRLATVAVRSNPHGRAMAAAFSVNHEYAVFWTSGRTPTVGRLPRSEARMTRYPNSDTAGAFTWINFRKTGADSRRVDRPKSFYPVYVNADGAVRVPSLEWSEDAGWKATEVPKVGETMVLPVDADGTERVWTLGVERACREISSETEARQTNGVWQVYRKYRPNEEGALPGTWWDDAKYSATESGTKIISELFGERELFSYPKSVYLVEDCLRVLGSHPTSVNIDYFAGSGTTGHAVINLNREDGGRRRFILVEMGDYFDTVLLPRIKKVTFTPEWKAGRPKRLATSEEAARSPRILKVVRLESYEDTLNNLETRRTVKQQLLLDAAEAQGADRLREQYILRYMLDVETRGSQSLLNMRAFTDPTTYKLKVKRPGSDESREANVDLLETFNWLIGITVRHIAAPQTFSAEFERDSEERLGLKGRLKQGASGPHWFRTMTGTTPDGRRTLIIWRKLTGEPEKDNLVLDEWFTKQGYSAKDSEFDLVYVNGGNNLENLKTPDELWKVRLIEEDFHRLMFEMEGA